MKNTLLLFAILLAQFQIFAQKGLSEDYSYEVSEPYQVYDSGKKKYFTDGESILSIKPWKGKVVIQKFDVAGLTEISSKEYEDLPGNLVVEGMLEAQGRYYFFYSSWSGRKTKHERLYSREIDFTTGEFIAEAQLLIDIEGKLAGSPMATYTSTGMPFGMGFGVVDKFDFLVSNDESKILIQYRKKPEVKKDTKSFDILGVGVYDISLEKLWSKEYKMPYTERRMDTEDFAVDDDGNGYILAKVYHDDSSKDKKRKKDAEANYHMEVLRLLGGESEIAITKIDLADKFINGISFFESPDGTMICAGFYTNGKNNKLGNADGLFTFKLQRDGTLIDESSNEIPLEVLNQYVKKSTKKKNAKKDKKGKAEFEFLKLKAMVIQADGSLVFIGEQSYVIRRYNSKGQVSFTFHNNDMLVSKIDALGNLAWMKKVPKRQAGKPKMGQVFDASKTYQGGMSYSYFYTNGNHYLVYLDNVKNIDLPFDKIPAMHTDGAGGYLTAYKINDSTGEVAKGSIFDTRNVAEDLAVYQFSNNRVIQTADDEFVIEFYKKKKEDVLVKVKIVN